MLKRLARKTKVMLIGRRYMDLLREHGSKDAMLIKTVYDLADAFGVEHHGKKRLRMERLPERILLETERRDIVYDLARFYAYYMAALEVYQGLQKYLKGVFEVSMLTDQRLAELQRLLKQEDVDVFAIHQEAKRTRGAARELQGLLKEDLKAKAAKMKMYLGHARDSVEHAVWVAGRAYERLKKKRRVELRR